MNVHQEHCFIVSRHKLIAKVYDIKLGNKKLRQSYDILERTGMRGLMSSDTIFTHIFHPFSIQLHFTFLNPPFSLMFILVMFFLSMPSRSRTDDKRTFDRITGHQTTRLLGYRHSETVLLWFPFTWILRWNLLCCH